MNINDTDHVTFDPVADDPAGSNGHAPSRSASGSTAVQHADAGRAARRRDPSIGELQLEERSSLRRVAGLSTELQDVTDAEYRQLRLERVVLVGVWTEGSAAQADAAMAELARLAETAGSEVCDAIIQR